MSITGRISPTGINSDTSGLTTRNVQQMNDIFDDIRMSLTEIGRRTLVTFDYQRGIGSDAIVRLPNVGFTVLGLIVVNLVFKDQTTTLATNDASPYAYWSWDNHGNSVVIRQVLGIPNNNQCRITVELIGE